MTTKINWKREAAGWYTATTPAGHEVEIRESEYGWVLSNTENGAGYNSTDYASTLWEAKEDANDWDAGMEAKAAWAAKEAARWSK